MAFFSTGDELRSVGETLIPGSLYDSNRYILFAMLTRLGVETIDLGIVRDDRASLEKALRHATECADVVISSGGVSVGDADFTRGLMNSLGDVAFWKIAMRPGRPLAFGRLWSDARGRGRVRALLRLARQSGRRDGDLLLHRAGTLLAMSGATRQPLTVIRAVAAEPIKSARAARSSSAASQHVTPRADGLS